MSEFPFSFEQVLAAAGFRPPEGSAYVTNRIDKPRGLFPKATGYNETMNVYRFGSRDLIQGIEDRCIGGIFRKAVLQPGVRVEEHFEENGYEYTTYAIYDPKENTVTTNYAGCPSRFWHHVGSTCSVCGLHG